MQQIRTVFFGTPSFVTAPLQALIGDDRFRVVGVVTQPAKPAGREGTVQSSPVAVLAGRHAIPVLTPDTLRDSATVTALAGFAAHLFVIDAYGKILPREVLDLPQYGCVNLHPSLLPRYRGATPVPFTILGGETETGMTFMRMSEGMDEGDILSVLPDRVLPTDDAPTLLDRLNVLAAGRIGDLLTDYAAGEITPVPQDHAQATYSTLLTKEHGRIDWATDTAVMVERKLRAYAPWPGIFTFYNGKRLKILACEVADLNSEFRIQNSGDSDAGSLMLPDLVRAKEGFLRLITVQPEGGKPMAFGDFLQGVRGEKVRFG